jgi:endonuclease III
MTATDLPAAVRILTRAFRRATAPVIELERVRTTDPFRILVATILSARTRDETTTAAVQRLFQVAPDAKRLAALSVERVAELIYPVGFYKTKARHLAQLPAALAAEGGAVPATIPALCRLPGVGRKTANLVMTAAFDKPAICVDVHVHRICNRWGLLRTRTPTETETVLRRILPRRYWKRWNSLLVAYGQTVCTPRHPQCGDCRLQTLCDYFAASGPSASR